VLKAVDEHEEQVWLNRIAASLNREFGMSLATSVAAGRTLASIRAVEEEETSLQFKVVGASNASRTAESLRKKGFAAEKVGRESWSLAIEKDVEKVVEELPMSDMSKTVLVLHSMDNETFMSMDRTGGTSLPKKEGGIFHIPGKFVVVTC